ncbi:MAG: 7-cyano-7-deazaguanine synthase QueC [Phycisphaerales bacterium]
MTARPATSRPEAAAERAVVLVSGGLDSAVVLAMALDRGLACTAISFDYGQRHRIELDAARTVVARAGLRDHRVVQLDLRAIGGSALTSDLHVPKDRAEAALTEGIPITYVPARNLVFLSLAAGLAEVIDARSVHIGVNALDYSGYPDCRQEFIDAFARCVALATRAGVEGHPLRVETPLLHLSKAEIIRAGAALGVDFSVTRSCYDPLPPLSPSTQSAPCGHCDSCLIRARGFALAGVLDPALPPPT